MAGLRGLLLALALTSLVSVAWQREDLQKWRSVALNVTTTLSLGFGDLMTLVCQYHCEGNLRVNALMCEPRVCIDCRCDSQCQRYGDCCPYPEGSWDQQDSGPSILPVSHGAGQTTEASAPTSSSKGSKVRWFGDRKTTLFDCVVSKPNLFSIMSMRSSWGVFMLRKCKSDFEDENVRHLCESEARLETPFPVASRASNTTYYNQFCAICNEEADLSYWKHNTSGEETLLSAPDGASFRSCDQRRTLPAQVHTCNVSGLWEEYNADVESRCLSVYYPIWHEGRVYRNFYCLMCNSGLSSPVNCSSNFQISAVLDQFTTLPSVGISILVDFLPSRQSSAYSPASPCRQRPHCEAGFWLDPFRVMCRKLLCRSGRELVNGSCVLSNPEIHTVHYRALLLLLPESETNLTHLTELIKENYAYFAAGFQSENMKIYISAIQNRTFTNAYLMDAFFLVKAAAVSEDLEGSLVNFVHSKWQLSHGGVKETIRSTIVESQSWLMKPISDPLTLTAIPGSTRFFPVSKYFELMEYSNFTFVPSSLFVNLTHHMVCPHVQIYSYGTNRTGLGVVKYENVTFDITEVSLAGDALLVCTDMLESLFNETYGDPWAEKSTGQANTDIDSKIRVGMSIFCTSFSLVCLFLTICTYCTFSPLRSQPGWNNLMLAVSLFSAQLTLMFTGFAGSSSLGCRTYGAVLHFLWLSAIMWMNVCSFHMFRTFSSSLQMVSDSVSLRRLAKYFAYAFGVSSGVVLTTMAASAGTSGGAEIGYGGRVCYLSTRLLVGLAFVLPLSLVLVANLVFFVITVRAIAATKQLHPDVDSQRSNVYIYFKLSSLTGVFWTVALLAEVTASQCLTLLSILLNSSQGVFLFFSFVFNKKVFRLWCARVQEISSSSTSFSSLSHRQMTQSSQL